MPDEQLTTEIPAPSPPKSIEKAKVKRAPKPKVNAKTKAGAKSKPEQTPVDGMALRRSSGRVRKFQVNIAGAFGTEYRFELRNKKGDRHEYLLDPSDPTRLVVFANLLNAAQLANAKVRVFSAPNDNGLGYASALEIQGKR
jgi:hypothetical protein